MTYCLSIAVDAGLVFISDSRTNAGVDRVSTYSKMHRFGVGERRFVLLSAGNLATTQGVVTLMQRHIKQGLPRSLATVTDMADAADYVGECSTIQQEKHGSASSFEASFIIGGQVPDETPSTFLVYPQGNHITTSSETPYLQIGESKYGKPILDRIIRPGSTLDTAALCGLVSMDSTMKSNLTVGPPIELLVYERDSFSLQRHYVFRADSDYLKEINKLWDQNLREAFNRLPPITWSTVWDAGPDGGREAGQDR
ncbi:MAG: peptidase [Pseudomonadales bacterium]|jgi:putative proteasome-type protease